MEIVMIDGFLFFLGKGNGGKSVWPQLLKWWKEYLTSTPQMVERVSGLNSWKEYLSSNDGKSIWSQLLERESGPKSLKEYLVSNGYIIS